MARLLRLSTTPVKEKAKAEEEALAKARKLPERKSLVSKRE